MVATASGRPLLLDVDVSEAIHATTFFVVDCRTYPTTLQRLSLNDLKTVSEISGRERSAEGFPRSIV